MDASQKLDEVELMSIAKGSNNLIKNLIGRVHDTKSKLDRDIGSIVYKFSKKLKNFDTDDCVPYFIFNLDYNDLWNSAEYVGVRYEDTGISLKNSRQRFQDSLELLKKNNELLHARFQRLQGCLKAAQKLGKRKTGCDQERYKKVAVWLKGRLELMRESYIKALELEKGITPNYGLISYDTEYEIKPMTAEEKDLLRKLQNEEITEDDVQEKLLKAFRERKKSRKKEKDPDKEEEDEKYLSLLKIKTLLSHQFCFDVNGKRFGLVFCTSERFTDEWFLRFLAEIVKRLSKTDVKIYYIFCHFSLAEASWLDNREKKIIPRSGKKWIDKTPLIEEEQFKKDGTPYKPRKFERVQLYFCDTKDLFAGSLEGAAKECGFQKKDLPIGTIENMSAFKRDHFEAFCRYSVRDVLVTSAIPLDIHSRFSALNLPFRSRISGYSEKYFKDFYETHYKDYGDWRELLGQVQGYQEGIPYMTWMPNRVQRDVLDRWYHGGRNEVKRVGCFGEAFYWDLKSAYPTAAVMMYRDFDFSRSRHYWGDEAKSEIIRLKKIGPFQPHGVTLFAKFKEGAVPMFPIEESGAIVFPRIFHGVVTWPEYWAATELDLLEEDKTTIIELSVFEALGGRKLPEDMKRLLNKRRENKLLFKNLLNYNYGKQVQGISGKVPFSSIACPALGAYMTGFCRAAVGTLANLNKDYYGITTDGFISPRRKLDPGEFNRLIAKELKTIGYKWIELEAHATKCFFIKTRGYGLWNGLKVKMKYDESGKLVSAVDEDKPEHLFKSSEIHFKKANMGLQASNIKDFIKQINAGKGMKKSFPGFSKMEPGEIAEMTEKEFTINTTFDMKHIPLEDTIIDTVFELDGVTLKLPSFETRPLNDVHEYQHLRELATIANIHKYNRCKRRGLNDKEIVNLLTAHALNDPVNRRLMWEFKKRLAQKIPNDQTTWTMKQQEGLKNLQLWKVDIKRDLSEYDWLFKNESRVIKDPETRKKIRKEIVAEMTEAFK